MKDKNVSDAMSTLTDTHKDERREISSVFNGDFDCQQLKMATPYVNAILGGHYHEYKEGFTVIGGSVIFRLYDIDVTGNEIYEYTLTPGNKLLIPARVAHDALLEKGATLIGFTEEKYVSPEHNDFKYDLNKIAIKNEVNKQIVNILNTLKSK